MHFDHITFTGGGNRCFWQAGFWSALSPALKHPPGAVAAVSAGAAMACVLVWLWRRPEQATRGDSGGR